MGPEFPGPLGITRGSLAIAAFLVWAQAVCLASGLALCPPPRIQQQGAGCESGQEPLAPLIGSVTFCSSVWIPGCSGSGSWQVARGSAKTAAPDSLGPRAQLASWRLASGADGRSWLLQVQGDEVLEASQPHLDHTWHLVGTCIFMFVNGHLLHPRVLDCKQVRSLIPVFIHSGNICRVAVGPMLRFGSCRVKAEG